MINKNVASKIAMVVAAATVFTGCNKGSVSYSLLDASADYKQQAVFVPKQIDVLWVIDNSGSMKTSQDNLVANFNSFISRFQSMNYDFHMAVTTTEAWKRQFSSTSTLARIKDGAVLKNSNPRIETSSGVFIMDKNTPNLESVFSINAIQGTLGNGDERAFSSFKETLMDPYNAAFRRTEAFLAVIIVSDEEDFSSKVSSFNESYTNPNLHTVASYVEFLDAYVGSKNYSVSTISIPNNACKSQLQNTGKVSTRLPELSELTGGIKGSLCEPFGTTLDLISNSIVQLTSVFKLAREPVVESIEVHVNNVLVPQDAVNGWTYNPADLTITFSGTAVPASDASIKIDFFPKSIIL